MINKQKWYDIIFGSDTPAGKRFDVILLWVIALSVLTAMFESVPGMSSQLKGVLLIAEWFFTILFSIEYFVRIYISRKPHKYIFSFWGIIDFVAILPSYISLFFFGYQYLLIVRIVRMLRVFRVLRMVRFSSEAQTLLTALRASMYKIGIFFFAVICIVVILGTLMYVVEGPENGFVSIFQGIYWAIITITTVGYGDIVPGTVLGKIISSVSMIIGYAILAVPTGIVTVEMSRSVNNSNTCSHCGFGNSPFANYCNHCGTQLNVEKTE
jgi:voltage-gated potassium channel